MKIELALVESINGNVILKATKINDDGIPHPGSTNLITISHAGVLYRHMGVNSSMGFDLDDNQRVIFNEN